MSSTYHGQDEQKRATDDGDSGFHELMDDPAAFELLSFDGRSSPSQAQLQRMQRNVGSFPASDSSNTTPEYSPVSPSPRIIGNESVSSTNTQPDGGMSPAAGVEPEESNLDRTGTNLFSTSPAASEEDVSEKESDDAFEDAGNSSPEEDELGERWNPDLYMLQSKAPKPEPVQCTRIIDNKPPHYASEYHGILSREDAADLLGSTDGHYLVRHGSDGDCILSFMLGGKMWNFKLYYEEKLHYVGEKRFDTVAELVQDGLISIFLSQHNVMHALEVGRNVTRRYSQKLKRKPCGRGKGPKGKGKSAYLERLRSGSCENLPPCQPGRAPSRQMSTPAEIQAVPMTPNSSRQQSDLDLTTPGERRGQSTSTLSPTPSSTANKHIKERRAFSTESLQQKAAATTAGNPVTVLRDAIRSEKENSPVTLLRDMVRADREAFSQSMEVSILSEKAAAILGIAPPKQYKRASMYDPITERRLASETSPRSQARSFTYHPGLKRGKAFDKGNSAKDLHKSAKKPPVSPSPYYKAHKFKPLTYIHPTWCVICHHFLWGLKMQGLRCQDCGIDIHRQCCAGSLDHECNPTKKIVKRMFGVDLTTRVKAEDSTIPTLLQSCIEHIDSTELKEEGLYRVSGQTSEILELKDKFDNGDKIDFSRYMDVNVVCGAVKLYLRELPIPVIAFDTYNEIMKATSSISDPNEKDVDWLPLVNALKLLPKAHYNVLKYLVEHLHRVDLKSGVNKMTAHNLSVVFAPTLMRSPSEDMSLVSDIPLQRHFLEILILKHSDLFN